LKEKLNSKDEQILKLIGEKNELLDQIRELNEQLKNSRLGESKQSSGSQNEMNNKNIKNQLLFQRNNFAQTNCKLSEENNNLKNKIILLEKEKEELINNNNLDNNNNIQNFQKLKNQKALLKNEKEEMQNNLFINIEEEDEKEIDLNNNEKSPFKITMNLQELNDDEKFKKFKERIKQCEQINESDVIQIKTLKEEIKKLKEEINNLETFGGQIKDINEFGFLFNQALNNYKPKKKEQKDALNKIVNIFNNFQK
jgi:hypothetical protein